MVKRNKRVIHLLITGIIIAAVIVAVYYIRSNAVGNDSADAVKVTGIFLCRDKVSIYWQPKSSSSEYVIYRKNGSGYEKRGTALGTAAFTDSIAPGQTYEYKITCGAADSGDLTVKGSSIGAPVMTRLETDSSSAALKWNAVPGSMYYVLRKPAGGSYSVTGIAFSPSRLGEYVDKTLETGKNYIYAVEEVRNIGGTTYEISDYDGAGIRTIRTAPKVTADYQNLKAVVSFTPVKGATGYYVYRKMGIGKGHKYTRIGFVPAGAAGGGVQSFTDVYHKTFSKKARSKYLAADYFSDSSVNKIVYTVRAVRTTRDGESLGSYLKDGYFTLATPVIVGLEQKSNGESELKWSRIFNAGRYYIYSGKSGARRDWKRIAVYKQKEGTVLSTEIRLSSDRPYVTVVAAADRNGVEVLSRHDNGFTAKNRKYSSHNVLFLGDSITYGSPYKGKTTRDIFSYPWRVGQLTGIRYYNPSIPGSTYAYRRYSGKGNHRFRIVKDVAEPISRGQDPIGPKGLLKANVQKYKDFDTIIMAAGTNDYNDNIRLGSLNSRNIHEFNGAVNKIIGYIKEGNKERVAEGKKPARIVFVRLFYSNRTVPPFGILNDRFTTRNELGLTLTDYQRDLNRLVKKYRKEGLDVYQFDTSRFVTRASCPYVTSDNLHMTRFTYSQIGNSLSAYLMKHVF